MKKITLGGDRLGGGSKNLVEIGDYGRSTFNIDAGRRTTIAPFTVVPVYVQQMLPNDTIKLEIGADGYTQPTIGPAFGSFDYEVHVFKIPYRLYNGDLMMDKLDAGYDLSAIKIPQVRIKAPTIEGALNNQIHPSAIFSHLNIRGLGYADRDGTYSTLMYRDFNAVAWLGYWEIYKLFFSNKQEKEGVMIHAPVPTITQTATSANLSSVEGGYSTVIPLDPGTVYGVQLNPFDCRLSYAYTGTPPTPESLRVKIEGVWRTPLQIFESVTTNVTHVVFTGLKPEWWGYEVESWGYAQGTVPTETAPQLLRFPLENIDTMRTLIMQHTGNPAPFIIGEGIGFAPYSSTLASNATDARTSLQFSQEGLGVTTYKSDIYNNWLNTEDITAINAASAINTESGEITIDEINMRKKLQNYLNRISVSGGSYYDAINVTYNSTAISRAITPVYEGSLLKEIGFDEVVSSTAAQTQQGLQPQGQLSGKGRIGNKNKGGKMTIRANEHCIIMAVAVIRARIDYSKGNSFIADLKTMDDFHKPEFDQIGFQDLVTDWMDYRSTKITELNEVEFMSIGKQPAWTHYTTDVTTNRGNFAIENNQMFMVMDRRYTFDYEEKEISDFTAYGDPSKFNYMFAETKLDAQNFWCQFRFKVSKRTVQSSRVMPTF